MADPDIVTRLRAVLHNDRSVELMNREAADEIERLRAERDEARQQYCLGFTDFCPNPAHDHLSLEDAAIEVAKSFGWDCFGTEPKP
jgi:hypothetical protein